MKKIRCILAAIALVATLSGLSLQGLGSSVLTHAAAGQYASALLVSGQSTRSHAPITNGPCPGGVGRDC